MMRTVSSIIAGIIFLVVPTVPLLAQSPSPVDTLRDRRQQLEERREDLRSRIATKQAERKEDRKELVLTRIRRHFERIVQRLTTANERYTKFLERVRSRRDKLESSGKDVKKLDTLISTAQGNQVKVVTAIEKLKTNLSNLDSAQNPKEAVSSLKDDVGLAKRAVQQLHASMKLVVQALKQGGTGSGRSTPSATSR